MAGYIIQEQEESAAGVAEERAPAADPANPFRILPPKTGEKRQPHPMIDKRFPIVLMLEPLHACNLTCTGCGRIREYESTISERVPLEECLAAVDECGAPMVSICGGEPMMYPQIGELVAGILERNRHIYPLHQRDVHQEAPARIHARQALLLQRAPGRHGEDSRHRRGKRGRLPRCHRGHQGCQGRRFPWCAPTPPSTKRRTWRKSRSCSSI